MEIDGDLRKGGILGFTENESRLMFVKKDRTLCRLCTKANMEGRQMEETTARGWL